MDDTDAMAERGGELVETLRAAFQRVRYNGAGPYLPEGDLLDVAADMIEQLLAARANYIAIPRLHLGDQGAK